MQTLKANCSLKIFSVLSQYPTWLDMIVKAIDKPQISHNYCPQVVEIFDQYGLLTGIVNGYFPYESTRKDNQKSEFIAWFLDGELAVFYVGSEIVINRLQNVALAFEEL